MNCDEQRETCSCTKLMKDDACTAANLTTATYIKRFMTSNCIKVHFSQNITINTTYVKKKVDIKFNEHNPFLE